MECTKYWSISNGTLLFRHALVELDGLEGFPLAGFRPAVTVEDPDADGRSERCVVRSGGRMPAGAKSQYGDCREQNPLERMMNDVHGFCSVCSTMVREFSKLRRNFQNERVPVSKSSGFSSAFDTPRPISRTGRPSSTFLSSCLAAGRMSAFERKTLPPGRAGMAGSAFSVPSLQTIVNGIGRYRGSRRWHGSAERSGIRWSRPGRGRSLPASRRRSP